MHNETNYQKLGLMLCHVQLNMVKKASIPEPASTAAEKPAKKPAAGVPTAKPAKRIAARVVKTTKEDTSPEQGVTPEHAPDKKVRPPKMHV